MSRLIAPGVRDYRESIIKISLNHLELQNTDHDVRVCKMRRKGEEVFVR